MSTQAKLKHSEIRDFGTFLRKAREKTGLSQASAAKEIAKEILKSSNNVIDIPLSQSQIAQLESGTNNNPHVELLQAIAEVYKLSYSSLVSEYIKDKLRYDASRAERLNEDRKTIEELAEWETNERPEKLWVVAPNFVDDSNAQIYGAVIDLIKEAKTEITYFVKKSDLTDTGRFTRFKKFVVNKIMKEEQKDVSKNILYYPLSLEQMAVFSISFVIANPGSALIGAPSEDEHRASGYYVIPEESGQPSYGIAISKDELRRLAHNLMDFIEKDLAFKKTSYNGVTL